LVDKTAFQYRGPRRWEVAVFRCPVDDAKPYVKRTVGLPGETIRLFDGDVLANGQILRKTLADLRDLRIPVFDMDYPPEPMGWGFRWRIEPILPESQLPALDPPPVLPKVEDIVQESRLILDGTATPNGFGLTYLHRNVDTREADVIRDPLGYNGGLRRGAPQPVHDFFLECEIEVLAGSGVFSCRLGDGGDTVRVDLPIAPPDQPATALTLLHDGGPEGLTNPNFRLQPGQRVKLEFAFVDRRLLLSLDGKDDVMPPLDLPALPQKRSGTDRPLQLGIRGASVVLHHLRISRDIHYRDDNSNGTGRTYVLGANEYFMMGDNSANSSDSRDWSTFGVARSAFIGKPFLIHQPLKAGRLTANGKEWKMQTVDWDRFRLLN
jgi:signal peptidase I